MTDTTEVSDGRPMVTDLFLVEVREKVEDVWDRDMAIKAWIEGDWDEAVSYLEEE